jgi:hypothetical protein
MVLYALLNEKPNENENIDQQDKGNAHRVQPPTQPSRHSNVPGRCQTKPWRRHKGEITLKTVVKSSFSRMILKSKQFRGYSLDEG